VTDRPSAPPTAPAVATPAGMVRVGFRAMGTDVDVLVPVGCETSAVIVRDVFAAWERRCSRFDPESELSRLNAAAGAPVVVTPALFDAIATALSAADATDGMFDPTVLHRLEDLGYDRTFAEVAPVGPAGERPTGSWTGSWREVRLDRASRTVELPRGVGLDLGGIAKGMAVDAALEKLVEMDVVPAAVDAGGDLAVVGTPPGLTDWLIAIETRDGGQVVALPHGALTTSSTARRRWTRGGREMNHLVDPRTGEPAATGITSVTVSAHRCAQAEVAAKTALLLGLDEGSAFLRRAGLSALVVDDAGTRHRVGRWLEPGVADPPPVTGRIDLVGGTTGGHPAP
jgi:thiamine biosynthesis lipoprotein